LNEWVEEGPKILKTLGEVKGSIVEAKEGKKIRDAKANTMLQYVNTATLAIEVCWRLENESAAANFHFRDSSLSRRKCRLRREASKSLHHLELGKNMAQEWAAFISYFCLT